jgi:hypothetical protein
VIFEEYARDWLERQIFSKAIRKTTRQSLDYICKGIGKKDIPEITDTDVDRIFTNEQLFRMQIDFLERTFRVLDKIFTEIRERGITTNDPVLHILRPWRCSGIRKSLTYTRERKAEA